MKEACPYCDEVGCNGDCEEYEGDTDDITEEVSNRLQYNAAIDGLESFIIACAGEGVDVDTPAFKAAIGVALEGINNNP